MGKRKQSELAALVAPGARPFDAPASGGILPPNDNARRVGDLSGGAGGPRAPSGATGSVQHSRDGAGPSSAGTGLGAPPNAVATLAASVGSPLMDSDSPNPAKKLKGKEAKGGSRFKGVYVDKAVPSKWKASIRLKNKEIHLGYYDGEEDAARAYDKASICSKGFPKNFELEDFDVNEVETIKAYEGNVEKLRVQMGIGLAAKQMSSSNRGVCIEKKTGKWRAEIQIDGKKQSLGYYGNEDDAVAAYDKACIVARGVEKCRTNKPLESYAAEMDTLSAFNGDFEQFQQTLSTKARQKQTYSSPYRGVRRHEHAAKKGEVSVKWRAEITVEGKKKSLGYHTSEKKAALAYDTFARTLPNFNLTFLNFADGEGGEQGGDDETAEGANGASMDAPAGAARHATAPGAPQVREKSLGGTKGKKAAAAAAAAAAEGNVEAGGYMASLRDD